MSDERPLFAFLARSLDTARVIIDRNFFVMRRTPPGRAVVLAMDGREVDLCIVTREDQLRGMRLDGVINLELVSPSLIELANMRRRRGSDSDQPELAPGPRPFQQNGLNW